jgi:hypothetical protein
VLAGAARGETGSKGGGGPVRLLYVDTQELAGFQNELVCRFMLVADVVRGGIRKFMNNADGPAFRERELVGINYAIFLLNIFHHPNLSFQGDIKNIRQKKNM